MLFYQKICYDDIIDIPKFSKNQRKDSIATPNKVRIFDKLHKRIKTH